jgi:hypothetical protein
MKLFWGVLTMSNNIIPFRPAATGLQEEYQTALFSDDEYIKLNLPRLTFPSDESCEGTTRWCNKAIKGFEKEAAS